MTCSKDRIYLVGYRGSGKSTVGRKLAEILQWNQFDSDSWIQEQSQKTISEIFLASGEDGFRDWESKAVQESAQSARCVIALGGGAVLRKTNRATILEQGVAIWLRAPADILFERINADSSSPSQRPSLSSMSGYDEVVHLLAQREPLYREVSQLTVDTQGRSPEELAEQIVTWWRSSILNSC